MRNRQYRTGSARSDWNERARADYRHAIDSTTSGEADEEAFCRSGENDVGQLLALLGGRDLSSWQALDYGCGAGRLMVPFSRHLARIDGVDISDEMVRIGRERNADRSDLGFHLLEKERLPFDDSSFDLIYSVIVFQHMPRQALAEMIPEFARVLRPGALLAFQLTAPYSLRRKAQAGLRADQLSLRGLLRRRDGVPETYRRRYYLRSQLDRLLGRNGLRIVSTRTGTGFANHNYYLAERRSS